MFDFLLLPIKCRWSKDRKYYRIVNDIFGFCPNNIELYKLALIHKSASVFLEDGSAVNNERLEFLGDAVLEAIISDYVFIEYPDRDEGFLTQVRSKIVSRASLNRLCEVLGLSKHIISNSVGAGFIHKHVYGDALEAMIGAIYLDKGYDFINRLVINDMLGRFDIEEVCESENDFKSRLIEWCQKNHKSIRFDTKRGEDYTSQRPTFRSVVFIDGMELGHGGGESKKEAEQRAAFSVSQVVSDEAGDQILEIVDRISEESSRGRAPKRRRRRAAKSSAAVPAGVAGAAGDAANAGTAGVAGSAESAAAAATVPIADPDATSDAASVATPGDDAAERPAADLSSSSGERAGRSA